MVTCAGERQEQEAVGSEQYAVAYVYMTKANLDLD
jgi:hypothetical protein